MRVKKHTRMWKCGECDKEFKYESERRRHEQSHMPTFECKVCAKKFSFLSAVRRHEKQHERSGSVRCTKCDGKFRDEILLKRHLQYAHNGTYTCTICNTKYNSVVALRIHMKIHKPEAERKFHCSHEGCGKTFNFTHHLKHHELTHTDVKQYFCKECGKGFIQLHHLKIHQKKHEPDSWLACTELNCNKQFADEYALKRHVATHKNKIRNTASKPKSMKSKRILLEVGDLVLHTSHHFSRKVYQKDNSNSCATMVSTIEINTKLRPEIESIKLQSKSEELKQKDAYENEIAEEDTVLHDCKSVLGSCLVTGDSDTNDKCICAQIPKKSEVDQYYEMISKNRKNVIITFNDDLKCEKLKNEPDACDSCECVSLCGIKTKSRDTEVMPELENRNDGIVKIKETFDADITNLRIDEERGSEYRTEFKDFNSVAINTCKDVLGNCIVSGNGTIGEGCLCAKMTATDQQMMTQEIEDITPCPKETWLAQQL